jgi:hypothetical protein
VLIREYPIQLQNDIQIVGTTEYGGYLVKYKRGEEIHSVIWLQDELINQCPMGSKGYEAIEVAKKYINSLLALK